MIRVRDDDILVHSSQFKDPFVRFQQIHNWILESHRFLHVPTILVTDIQEFPETIDYIEKETKEGRMQPEIHGLLHVDYAALDENQIDMHLTLCMEWFENKLDIIPTKWYTPWGAGENAKGQHLSGIAKKFGLKLVGLSKANHLPGTHGVVQRLKDGESLDFLEGDEIFTHWWERGLRLKRVIEVAKRGSWEEAVRADPKLFK